MVNGNTLYQWNMYGFLNSTVEQVTAVDGAMINVKNAIIIVLFVNTLKLGIQRKSTFLETSIFPMILHHVSNGFNKSTVDLCFNYSILLHIWWTKFSWNKFMASNNSKCSKLLSIYIIFDPPKKEKTYRL